MKAAIRIAALVIVAIVLTSAKSFALVHNWSHQFGAGGLSAVATDALGNVYAAGTLTGTANFGGGDRTSNAGSDDIILVKFNQAGVWQWDHVFGDASPQQLVTGVATDPSGNVFVAGAFYGSVNFGGGPLASLGLHDVYVAKFTSAGTYVWAKRFGNSAEQYVSDITVDIGGNAYVVGEFDGSLDFGGGALVSQGGKDAFVAKLDPAGAHLWSKRFGDASYQSGAAVATDHWGNVFFGINFLGTINVGGGDVTSAANLDIELVQYGAAGNFQWADHFGGANNQEVVAIATEVVEGYPYLTGYNEGTVDFGGGPIVSHGEADLFLAKFDCFGAHVWSRGFGDGASQWGSSVAVDALGDVYVAGYFAGTIHLGTAPITSTGGEDIFLAKFSDAGGHLWSHGYGSAGTIEEPTGVTVDGDYNVTMTGGHQGNINFGGGNLTSTDFDFFMVQFGPGPTGVRTPLRNTEALWAAPNPFNPLTIVHYSVEEPSHVRVDIFDVRGARVATLVNRDLHAGTFTATWNGVDERGTPVSSGVYFARLTAGAAESRVKLVLLK